MPHRDTPAPWATRAALAALSALAVAAADNPGGAVDDPGRAAAGEPSPRQVFETWFERSWGFDSLESYVLRWPDGISSEFLLARRFVDGRAEVAIDVEAPADSRNQAYLLRQRPDGVDELFYVPRPDLPRPTWRVRSLPATQLAAQLPGFPGWLTLLEIRPLGPGEFRHARLPDEIVEGEPCRVVITLMPEAAETFQEWRVEHFENQPPAGLFASHYGKLPGFVLRLALVLEFLWWAASDTAEPSSAITKRATAAAAGLVSGYFLPMARRAYGDAALPEEERGARTIAHWIVSEQVGLLNARDLRRTVRLPGLRAPGPVNAALDYLEDADWVRATSSREGGTKGRARSDYVVNPRARHL